MQTRGENGFSCLFSKSKLTDVVLYVLSFMRFQY